MFNKKNILIFLIFFGILAGFFGFPQTAKAAGRTTLPDGSVEGIRTDELTDAIDVKDGRLVGSKRFRVRLSSTESYLEFGNGRRSRWIRSTPLGFKKTRGKTSREVIVFDGVMKDVDVTQRVYEGRTKEDITLLSEEATTTFRFRLAHSDDLVAKKRGKTIVFLDKASRRVLMKVEAPYAVDAKGTRYGYEYALDGDMLTLRPSAPLKDVSYPLVIDPSYTIVTGALTNGTPYNSQRKLARSSNGDLHCVYHRLATVNNIFYAKSIDGGQIWTESALTSDTATTNAQEVPSIAVDGNDYLHVVWTGGVGGVSNLRYRQYTTSWQPITEVTSETMLQHYPSIAVDSTNNLHVVFRGYVADYTYYQVRYIKKTSGTWGSIQNLTTESYAQNLPTIAIDGNDYLHVAWYGAHSGSTTVAQIRYRKYTTSWQSIENLTSDSVIQQRPCMAVDGNNYIHIVWSGTYGGGPANMQVRYIKNAGGTWDASPTTLTSDSYDQQWPSLSVDASNNLHVVWFGCHAGSTLYYQIRYMKCTGGTWDAGVTNLTTASVSQRYPNVIWARWPVVSGNLTNRPKDGYAFIWADGTTVKYYCSSDLSWDAGVTLNPNANGTNTAWTWTGGSANYTNWQTNDGDTTYAYAAAKTLVQTVNLDDTALSGTINSVTVYAICRQTTGNELIQLCVKTGATPTNYFSADTAAIATSYTSYSNTWTTNPATSAAWTWSEINSLEAGVQSIAAAAWGGEERCTQVYVVVDYTAPNFNQTHYRWRNDDGGETGGALDAGFGTGGVVTVGAGAQARSIAIDSTSGYMYVFGYNDSTNDWRIEKRLLSDGSLVNGFGTGGVVTGDPATDIARAIAIDSTYMYLVGTDTDLNWRIEKRRLDTGALDTGFDGDGVVTGVAASSEARAIAIDSTYMYVVGYGPDVAPYNWRIEKRRLDTGALDTGFDGDGVVDEANASYAAQGIAIDSTYMYVVGADDNIDWRIEKRRLDTGALDTGFDGDGVVTGVAASKIALAIAIDSTSGYMYVVGYDLNATNDWRIEKRLLSDGSLVAGFGTGGMVTGVAASNTAWSIAIDSTYMYVVGYDATPDWRIEKRLLSDGSLVAGFGTGGVVTGAAASDTAYDIAIDSAYMYVVGYDATPDWRIEKRALGGATWKAAEDTEVTGQAKNENIRLRFAIANTGGASASSYQYLLEYSTSTGGPWTAVPVTDTQPFEMTATTWYADNGSTTGQLTGTGTWQAGTSIEDPSNKTASYSLSGGYYTEFEYCFKATNNATDGGTYYFRLTKDGTALNSYSQLAKITIAGATVVTLNSFTARGSGNSVDVEWETKTEIDNLGFNLYRSTERNGTYIKLNSALIPGLLSSVTGRKYFYADTNVIRGKVYYYKLEDIDLNGMRTIHGPICVDWDVDGIPDDEDSDIALSDTDSEESSSVSGGDLTDYNGGIVTHVELQWLRALKTKDGVMIEWRTGYEVDNLGFHVYSEENGQLYRLTPELIAGSALLAGSGTALTAGRSYTWWDFLPEGAGHVQYWLEDIDLNGKRTMHGPVEIKPLAISGQQSALKHGQAKFLSEFGMRLEEKYRDYWRIQKLRERLQSATLKERSALGAFHSRQEPQGNEEAAPLASRPKADRLMQHYLANMPAVKISVKEEGWYRISQPELVAAGFNSRVNPRYLQLFVDGKEQPIRVIGERDGRFNPQDAIEFYGVGLDTPSTDTRVYWLIAGYRPGKRIHVFNGRGGQLASVSFPYTVERKDRTIYFAALKNGDEDNFFGPVVAGEPVDQLMSVLHLSPAPPGEAILEVALQGATNVPHRIKVLLNETEVGEVVFDGQSPGTAGFTIPQSLLLEGDNLVSLIAQNGEMDVSVVNYIRLTYWHTYTADDDALKFTAQGGKQISIAGFSNPKIRVIDITNPKAVYEVAGTIKSQGTGYSNTFRVPGYGQRTLLALTEEKVKNPAGIVANQPSSWHQSNSGYDFVIIAHRDFFENIKPLKNLRGSQGLSVALIDVEDLYDEFSFGAKNPQALLDFLSLKKQWGKPPRFLLLVGDASFDPRNYLGFGDLDFVPTKLIDTAYLETASDDWFVDFNGDKLPEMAVGRLPVRTADEANTVISKIIGYEQSAPIMEALLVADKNDGFNFEAASEEVGALLQSHVSIREIFRGNFSSNATAKNELLSSIDQGPLLVNYTGHGSVEIWRGNILTSDDAEGLINGLRLPFFVSMTCLNGFFHDLYTESLAEALLKAKNGGAMAVWASSGLTEPDGQNLMNKELIRLLFNGNSLTIGEATARAKAAVGDQDIRRTWILFGDPATRLK